VPVEVVGIDHVYVTVRDLERSEQFYDRAMGVLGFRKGRSPIGGDPHVHYYNRQYGYSLRPARRAPPTTTPTHLAYTISASGWSMRPPWTAPPGN
jgi:catechol 2,3-dioxygenase-like lactoylglutathione lyase family enzyme